jgi:hypothetical protein
VGALADEDHESEAFHAAWNVFLGELRSAALIGALAGAITAGLAAGASLRSPPGLERCRRDRGMLPNSVVVDFYERSGVVATAAELNARRPSDG